jgi:hypothetical protein
LGTSYHQPLETGDGQGGRCRRDLLPRRRAATALGHTRDAGSEFGGAPRTVLTVHARAGEQAAATPWLLAGSASRIGEDGAPASI